MSSHLVFYSSVVLGFSSALFVSNVNASCHGAAIGDDGSINKNSGEKKKDKKSTLTVNLDTAVKIGWYLAPDRDTRREMKKILPTCDEYTKWGGPHITIGGFWKHDSASTSLGGNSVAEKLNQLRTDLLTIDTKQFRIDSRTATLKHGYSYHFEDSPSHPVLTRAAEVLHAHKWPAHVRDGWPTAHKMKKMQSDNAAAAEEGGGKVKRDPVIRRDGWHVSLGKKEDFFAAAASSVGDSVITDEMIKKQQLIDLLHSAKGWYFVIAWKNKHDQIYWSPLNAEFVSSGWNRKSKI